MVRNEPQMLRRDVISCVICQSLEGLVLGLHLGAELETAEQERSFLFGAGVLQFRWY